MDLIDLMWISIVAFVIGTVAQMTSKYGRGGAIVNLIVAYLGAVVGVLIPRTFNLPFVFQVQIAENKFPLLWAAIGSAIFVAGVGFMVRPGRR